MELFHRFKGGTEAVALPLRFNNPFYYSPHRLCMMAADEVRAMLSADEALAAEAAKGKMFGVLVVQRSSGEVGFLAAFSGLLLGYNRIDGFVPPVYDLLSPSGYFKQEEENITELNRQIGELEHGEELLEAAAAIETQKQAMERELAAMRQQMQRSKQRRRELRMSGGLSAAEEAALVRESQFQKAELKRATARWQQKIAECEEAAAPLQASLAAMKEERKRRSAALQRWLFEQFNVLNAAGEEKSLLDIFSEHSGIVPPAGAGECAAPKLMQYAYRNSLKPLAVAEFWVGASPAGEVRRDGCFYGACKSKCEPILGFMLRGLDVEDNALEKGGDVSGVEIVYEDDAIVVVNKPAGVLSVPGIVGGTSVQQWLRDTRQSNDIHVVHRLDMATSGLLVAAKSMAAYKELQRQFAGREVKKQYIATVEGTPRCNEGVIELPLAADYENRPCQKVDYTAGKPSVTRYKVLGRVEYSGRECSVVSFVPVTGRTHQLRVHAAHSEGLDCPIVGDALYGTKNGRLMLHAASICFVHPVSGMSMKIEKHPDFCKEIL